MTRWLLLILEGLVIVILLLGWIALAPKSLGGRTIYVTTAGASMEPSISEGDLVVLRKSANYEVGDIVAYDADNSLILHRIVGTDGERFILQGDNNPIPDTERPAAREIRGQLWLLLTPPWEWGLNGLVLLGLTLILVILVAYLARNRITSIRPLQQLARHARRSHGGERYVSMLGPLGQGLVVFVTALGVGALLLAAIGFSRPLERSTVDRVPYQHLGIFGYSAPAEGTVYDDDIAITGSPLYRNLVDNITVDFRYVLTSEQQPVAARGSYRVDAVISNSDGWSTMLPLVPDRQFSSSQFEATVILDLSAMELLITAFEEQIGLEPGSDPLEYQLSVAPVVRVDGTVGGQQIRDTFAPSLDFQWDDQRLMLSAPSNGGETVTEPTTSVDTGFVTEDQSIPNEVPFLIGDLDIATTRQLSIIGLALAIILGTALLLMIQAAMRAPEPAQIDARYGSRILDLRATNLKSSGRLIELAAFEDLATIAKDQSLYIMRFQRKGRHYYFVHTLDVTYAYRSNSQQEVSDSKPPVESKEKEALPESE